MDDSDEMFDEEEYSEEFKELLDKVSKEIKYSGRVFEAPGIYFALCGGQIYTISDDASCSPKGGWFPDIVTGPTDEETDYLRELMEEHDIDEYFFREMLKWLDDNCSETDAIEYFEGEDDEDSLETCKAIIESYNNNKGPFSTFADLVAATRKYGLEQGVVYYEWEGEWIDMYENICDCGEAPGYYDSLDEEEWIEILKNLDDHIVEG